MADLLVSELVSSRNFVVLERGQLDTVVDEISRQRHRLFRDEGKVDEGRLDNAQYLIRGVITDFSQTGGGELWMRIRHWFIGGGGYTARVSLVLTIVDVETGTIVDSVQSSGKARAREAYVEADYKGIQFGGKAFFRTPLGVATAEAIRNGLRGITHRIPRQAWKPMIADVQDTRIILNGGKYRGIREGQHYHVRGRPKAVTDPLTGDVLDMLPGPVIATIEIQRVLDAVAVGEKISGGGVLERGQSLEQIRRLD
jgi:curli biogenesis system outer membrane secretion channel CsgG